MRFKHDGNFYSAHSLAQALEIDPQAVTRWIKSGHLRAKLRGTELTPDGRQLEVPNVLPHLEMLPNKLCEK
jgi:hypothetical protein